jgi:ribose 5-phosphate isomerase A
MGRTFMTIYERALDFVTDGDVIGVGSGRASAEFTKLLGTRVREGLRVRGVPTSQAAAALMQQVGVPSASLSDVPQLAVAVDGADEVDPQLDLIKGYGRALVREKIVAASAKKLIILVGPNKMVPVLGSRGNLPVEVLPFALPLCLRRVRDLSLDPIPFEKDGKLFLSDNGNAILDCGVKPIARPAELEAALRAIPGVVGTGLFLHMAHLVLLGDEQFNLTAERIRPST